MRKLSPIQRAYVNYLKKDRIDHPSTYERDRAIVQDNIWQLRELV